MVGMSVNQDNKLTKTFRILFRKYIPKFVKPKNQMNSHYHECLNTAHNYEDDTGKYFRKETLDSVFTKARIYIPSTYVQCNNKLEIRNTIEKYYIMR